ncbi:helix-turn-helix domain-containing protein [Agromyces seonyuensis]|uniref:Helix-turn-helix domain-containing protein n=1 Tax=Agromyces seonyuensis TaxID=2662446 RepID=A0A6I4NVY4_9MICO|nr:helix-turn-helix transcriptional regulator [Agromyces seonyuensis]MWB98413.1 hypothetical protein [Agromyces seonyuensis]
MAPDLERLLADAPYSGTELAVRSGVSRSTRHRILTGEVDPRLGTLRELAIAAGYDLELSFVPLSDPDAAWAARTLIDRTFLVEPTAGVEQWVSRLRRIVPDGDALRIARAAGEASALLRRPGTLFRAGRVAESDLAAAAELVDGRWAASGSAVLQRLDPDAAIAGPIILYTDDPVGFAELLPELRSCEPEAAALVIAPYAEELGIDTRTDGALRLVAPVQGLIDAFGVGGALGAAAAAVAGRW